jgi:hypothetical protein
MDTRAVAVETPCPVIAISAALLTAQSTVFSAKRRLWASESGWFKPLKPYLSYSHFQNFSAANPKLIYTPAIFTRPNN